MEELIKKIQNQLNLNSDTYEIKPGSQVDLIIPNENLLSTLQYLKSVGFLQLSLITAVDWIKSAEFELIYTLRNWEIKSTLKLKIRINRDKPEITTVQSIFPTAVYYERDIWEFFGIIFIGHNELKPLFLENWDDMAPMRKDFDPQEYSDKKYGSRTYPKVIYPDSKVIS